MALTPYQANAMSTATATVTPVQPSKTYEFDFDSGEFTERMIDEETALKQAIAKSLRTPRFRYLIYTTDYGSEIMGLIGADVTQEYLNAEIPRMVKEALLVDDRIDDILDVVTTREKEVVNISFQVVTSEGFIFNQEVAV